MSALGALFRQLARDIPLRGRISTLACIDDAVQLPDVVVEPGCHIGANVAFESGAATVVGQGGAPAEAEQVQTAHDERA